MTRAVLAAAFAASALFPAFARADEPPVVESDRVDVAPANGVTVTEVRVDNRFGDIRVQGHDEPTVKIYAVKRAPDDATMDRLKVSLVPDPSGPIRIATSLQAGPEARPVAAGQVRIDLEIRVPRAARVDATTWNGMVALANLDSGAEVTTNQGDISVENVSGDVSTHAGDGDQRFKQVYGELEAEGVGGDMDLDVVKGERLGARLHDGRIAARGIRVRHVSIRTTRGDIAFEGETMPGGSYQIASYRGNVDVTFRTGTAFRVEALARRGTVLGPNLVRSADGTRMVGTYGGGNRAAGVVLRSAHGDIRVGLAGE